MMNPKSVLENKTLKLFLFFIFIVICIVLGRIFRFDVEYLKEQFLGFPLILSGIIFILLYVVLTTFIWLGPKDVFRVSAGILFGAYVSTLFVWISELINAAVMYSLSRSLGRDYIRKRFKVKEEHVERARETTGFWGIFAWKINLLVPLRFIDLGYGLTPIPLKRFLLGSLLPVLFRIYIQQSLFAKVGTAVLTDPDVVKNYLQADLSFAIFCLLYILVWAATTLIAAVFWRKGRKGRTGRSG